MLAPVNVSSSYFESFDHCIVSGRTRSMLTVGGLKEDNLVSLRPKRSNDLIDRSGTSRAGLIS